MKLAFGAVFLLAVASPLLCSAKLVIFGDSLSDNGVDGILAATELVNNRLSTGPVNVGVYPPSPYYQGRFTNGYIWVDVASRILGQEVDNYASGGANGFVGEVTVEPPFGYVTSPTTVPVRSLVQQAESYAALNADATATSADTVVVFTGVDEYFQNTQLNTGPLSSDDVISAVNTSLSLAYAAGARNFVLVDLPALTAFPFAAGGDSNSLDAVTSSHNDGLTSVASTFNSTNADASVVVYSVGGLFTQVLTNSAAISTGPVPFTNTAEPCRGNGTNLDAAQASGFSLSNCPNGDAYVFWDAVHPTKHMHQIIGQDFALNVNFTASAAVPVSST